MGDIFSGYVENCAVFADFYCGLEVIRVFIDGIFGGLWRFAVFADFSAGPELIEGLLLLFFKF